MDAPWPTGKFTVSLQHGQARITLDLLHFAFAQEASVKASSEAEGGDINHRAIWA